MPFRYRRLQAPRGISVMGFKVASAVVGAVVMWVWLWFCTGGGNVAGGF